MEIFVLHDVEVQTRVETRNSGNMGASFNLRASAEVVACSGMTFIYLNIS
jgi:hypothetical protein